MCGICGLWSSKGLGHVDPRKVGQDMGNAILHRGPDGEGIWYENDVLLVHRRLAVIDTSAAGSQPMMSECGRFILVFNGEIYNHPAIRTGLEQKQRAPTWRGQSDTETILAAFSVFGVKATLQKLVGMFAIALWDRKSNTLTLARDRAGEKPLYYTAKDGQFIFGSDLGSFHKVPGFSVNLERRAPQTYLRYGYVPAPFSIYEEVYKLEAGQMLTIAQDSGRFDLNYETYWSLEACIGDVDMQPRSVAERIEALEQVLRQSVQDQMISDVPLGAFLSGGVDSSLIVALMQDLSAKPVKTFTIGFHDKAYDESEQARDVAAHLQTDHTDLILQPQDIMAVVPKLPLIYSEPFADSSQLPTYLVAQLARQSVTVALSGDAGDEVFAGYNRYLSAYQTWKSLTWIPAPLRAGLARLALSRSPVFWDKTFAAISPILPKKHHIRTPGDKLHKLAGVMSLSRGHDFYAKLTHVCQDPDALLVSPAPLPAFVNTSQNWPNLDPFQHVMMAVDFMTYLADDILVKVDRAAMANSLETRAPFLDHRVISEAWSMPFNVKAAAGVGKSPLREILYKYVPQSLIDRPKMGFGIPVGDWMRGPLRDWFEAQVEVTRLQKEGIFDPVAVSDMWQEHLRGERNWQHVLWNIAMFQAWQAEYHPTGLT